MRVAKAKMATTKKQHILQIASTYFESCGYEKTLLCSIAKDAEVSLNTIYGLFKSKEELFLEHLKIVMEKSCKEILELFAIQKYSPVDKLRAIIDYKFKYFALNEVHMKDFLMKHPMFFLEMDFSHFVAMRDLLNILADIFAELATQYELSHQDYMQHAYNFKAATNAYIQRWRDDNINLEEKKEEVLDFILRGVFR